MIEPLRHLHKPPTVVCLRWADEAANDEQRETLLEIARLWTQTGPQGAKGGFGSKASQGL
jgi:hypothetical protein